MYISPNKLDHNLKACCKGRPVEVAPVIVEVGEVAMIALPYSGRTATEVLNLMLSGKIDCVSQNVNLTDQSITIYHTRWSDTGNNAGYVWNEDLEFEK